MNVSFSDLALISPLQRALDEQQYRTPTPIQARAIPHLLAGRDLLGVAQTGTGKTAAFALPILQRLAEARPLAGKGGPRALVLVPTRELAVQVGDSFRTYGRHIALRQTTIFGGVGQRPQVDALRRGPDIVVATPGRLLDLLGQGHLRLNQVAVLVLDEADRMLDMGFIHDVRKIVAALPRQRQTILFSATMPSEVGRLAEGVLQSPIKVEAAPVATPAERIDQRVFFVDGAAKRDLLADLVKDPQVERAIVFTRTKRGADRVAEQLERIAVRVAAIHGNKSQNARQRALDGFRSGRTRVLVATDIAARGIDIDGITHVINYDLPHEPESYVHRIGRTGRAGAQGIALSFCDATERPLLRDIERLTRRPLAVVDSHPYATPRAAGPASLAAPAPGGQQRRHAGGSATTGGPGRSVHRAPGRGPQSNGRWRKRGSSARQQSRAAH